MRTRFADVRIQSPRSQHRAYVAIGSSEASDRMAISVHLYGPRMGQLDGRDYDPSQNYVCDRQEI